MASSSPWIVAYSWPAPTGEGIRVVSLGTAGGGGVGLVHAEALDDTSARIQRARQIDAERRVARTVAQEKASRLLLALLSPEEAESYRLERRFVVRGSLGGRYRINPGTVGNVHVLSETGEVTARLCAHPDLFASGQCLPDADVALAQMFALTTDEAHFLRTANVHWGHRPFVAA